jgi:putative chitinase
MIGKLTNLARKIRLRGDASQPIKRVNEALNEALEDAPVVPERVKETPKSDIDESVMSKKSPSVNLPPVTHPGAIVLPASFNAAVFFDHIRPMFGRLSQTQVEGCEAILKAMKGDRVSWCAYALATAFHETGRRMSPNTESLNYSVAGLDKFVRWGRISGSDARRLGRKMGEPALSKQRQREIANIIYGGNWGRSRLGNTQPDDGWTYRGRGMHHVTGRANYGRASDSAGMDLVAEPAGMLHLERAARVMTSGMRKGRYAGDKAGRHSFARHLSSLGAATEAQFIQARRIINGLDKAAQIAGYAMRFQQALIAAGWR